jgi:hypothetical protein
MATREEKFKQAAWAYLGYGILYWVGGFYLATRGIAVGRGVVWFVLGAIFILLFPWLIARGHRGRGYLWFCRILTLFVAYRAFEVGRVALAPKFQSVPLPGGGEIPMSVGAGVFFLIALAAGSLLARAAWAPRR